MGCPCHIAPNTAKKATGAFFQVNKFNIEHLLVEIYSQFDFSSEGKTYLLIIEFCDQEYCKILTFHSVRWLE